MFRRCLSCLLALVALSALAACASSTRPIEKPTVRYTVLKGDPKVVFTTSTEMLLIDITSPSGIGSVAITKASGDWPPKIVMRLHLRGLESFKFTYGTSFIEVAVSATGQVREIYTNQGLVSTLSPGDPNWLNVTHKSGYFDVEAPAAFSKSGENKFTIEWIDFYR